MIRCVVFDVDDTLYLERDYVRSGFAAAAVAARALVAPNVFAETCWRLFLEGQRGDIFDRAFREAGVAVPEGAINELVVQYRRHRPDITFLPDARLAVEWAVARGAAAAVTDGPGEMQAAKVAALALERFLDPVVLTARLGPQSGKPSPDAFRLVEQHVGARGASCVYVADNPVKDFAGPKQLGWRTLRVRRHGGLHRDVPSGTDVDAECETLADLPQIVESWKE